MQTPRQSERPLRGGDAAFALVQVVFVIAAAALAYAQWQRTDRGFGPPPKAQLHPRVVQSLYDDPRVVTDAQLFTVLHKLRPRLAGPSPKINDVDHALRLWGAAAKFHDAECLSGAQMRELLLNHEQFSRAWGDDTRPLLVGQDGLLRVREKQGDSTASHTDHTLASLAEAGTPLDYPVTAPGGSTIFGTLLAGSLRTFQLNQVEYEWSILAWLLYLEPGQSWRTYEGQEVDFDRLARRLMRQQLDQGVCYAQHRLHTLVMMLRIDAEETLLAPETRAEILAYLQGVTATLVQSQHPEGYWGQRWWTGRPPLAEDEPLEIGVEPSRILATGHVLEWMALAPEEVHPPREALVRAGQWLARTIAPMSDQQIKQHYTFLSHAGRALALWRGKFPADFIQPMEQQQQRAG